MWWCVPSANWALWILKLELWSLNWVSDWERLSTAAVSGSWWVKALLDVQRCKSLSPSSRNDGKLPGCPGMLSTLSG